MSFYSLNEQIAAERAENLPPGTAGGQYKGRPAAGAAKNGQTGAAPASVGGYARYCEDYSTQQITLVLYIFFINESYKIAQVYTLITNTHTSFRYTVFKDRRAIYDSLKELLYIYYMV